MRIRKATLRDYSKLVTLDWPARSSRDRNRRLRRAISEGDAYVVADHDRLVAYGVLTRSFFQRPFIETLQVAQKERRKGYGSRLLARMEAGGLRHGEVWASTNRSNSAMRALLKKRGFILTGRVSRLDRGDVELFYCKKSRNDD